MAFLSKVGNILRQTSGKQISSEFSSSRPSLYQAIRWMSSSKLFIGGVSSSHFLLPANLPHSTQYNKRKGCSLFLIMDQFHHSYSPLLILQVFLFLQMTPV
uniref:Uncharacterized protein MANES_14G085900 n=1 Tax=Rhizophora mucronata TaxID=61149 RepID=A0A2P2KTL1_RHIMU